MITLTKIRLFDAVMSSINQNKWRKMNRFVIYVFNHFVSPFSNHAIIYCNLKLLYYTAKKIPRLDLTIILSSNYNAIQLLVVDTFISYIKGNYWDRGDQHD